MVQVVCGYSITWSARPSTDGGMVKPGALARREVDEQLAPFVMLLVLTSPEANPRIETEVSLFDRQSLCLGDSGTPARGLKDDLGADAELGEHVD